MNGKLPQRQGSLVWVDQVLFLRQMLAANWSLVCGGGTRTVIPEAGGKIETHIPTKMGCLRFNIYRNPETNIALENWLFGDYFPFGMAYILGASCSFQGRYGRVVVFFSDPKSSNLLADILPSMAPHTSEYRLPTPAASASPASIHFVVALTARGCGHGWLNMQVSKGHHT